MKKAYARGKFKFLVLTQLSNKFNALGFNHSYKFLEAGSNVAAINISFLTTIAEDNVKAYARGKFKVLTQSNIKFWETGSNV